MLKHPLDERSNKLRSATIRKLAPDGKTWTPTESHKRDRLLKQFCKQAGPAGTSDAYRDGWERIWGKK